MKLDLGRLGMNFTVENIQQQLAEIDFLEAAYPELKMDTVLIETLKGAIEEMGNDEPSFTAAVSILPDIKLQLTLGEAMLGHVIIIVPKPYPSLPVCCELVANQNLGEIKTIVNDQVKNIFNQNYGEVHILQILQFLESELADILTMEFESTKVACSNATIDEHFSRHLNTDLPLVLGRRVIYSHHIISKFKRRDMKELANNLCLGGYCKIGWPGVIIIEGSEENCKLFVNTIQRWRWKHLVVRGEQTIALEKNETIQSVRAFHPNFEELGESDMSLLAHKCKEVGLEELFLTCMKIYKK